ncbi:hypothetical protein B0H63DRAFT_449128 [Podospora didyma]|uniref:Uncharacterized protein n=1 Tax=Podospora didyma TaxID=330526 RepID=A0AAE0NNZ6_9PEZI|nr:hypothetical protein B0H63DRAFT_449128 [Podospora didyma]
MYRRQDLPGGTDEVIVWNVPSLVIAIVMALFAVTFCIVWIRSHRTVARLRVEIQRLERALAKSVDCRRFLESELERVNMLVQVQSNLSSLGPFDAPSSPESQLTRRSLTSGMAGYGGDIRSPLGELEEDLKRIMQDQQDPRRSSEHTATVGINTLDDDDLDDVPIRNVEEAARDFRRFPSYQPYDFHDDDEYEMPERPTTKNQLHAMPPVGELNAFEAAHAALHRPSSSDAISVVSQKSSRRSVSPSSTDSR